MLMLWKQKEKMKNQMLRKETLNDDIENDYNHKRDFYGFAIDYKSMIK